MESTTLPPEAISIKDLNRIAAIIALIFGVLFIIIGAITLIIVVGIIPLIFGLINLWIRSNIQEINHMVSKGEYEAAKHKQLIWTVIGFLLAGIIVGIILLIAYLKYDDLIRHTQSR